MYHEPTISGISIINRRNTLKCLPSLLCASSINISKIFIKNVANNILLSTNKSNEFAKTTLNINFSRTKENVLMLRLIQIYDQNNHILMKNNANQMDLLFSVDSHSFVVKAHEEIVHIFRYQLTCLMFLIGIFNDKIKSTPLLYSMIRYIAQQNEGIIMNPRRIRKKRPKNANKDKRKDKNHNIMAICCFGKSDIYKYD